MRRERQSNAFATKIFTRRCPSHFSNTLTELHTIVEFVISGNPILSQEIIFPIFHCSNVDTFAPFASPDSYRARYSETEAGAERVVYMQGGSESPIEC